MQSKANSELELKTLQMKLDQEVIGHKETVAKFNADKKHILMSTEEANLEAMKGIRHMLHEYEKFGLFLYDVEGRVVYSE